MRLLLRSTRLLLLLYLLGVGGLAWWVDAALEGAAAAVMDDTAELVASEVAAALDEGVASGLLQGEPADRLRLLNQLHEHTRRSAMVRSLEVVDETGEVFASGRFESVGRRLPPPERVFGSEREPRLLAESAGKLAPRRYVLAMPLVREGRLLGYLRIGLDSSQLAVLYDRFHRRLLLGAVGTVALVAALAYSLHLQLRQRTRQLVTAVEAAAAGGEATDLADELSGALAAAGRIGRELQQARSRDQAGKRLAQLAQMMDVGVLLLSRDGGVDFASDRARELLGLPAATSPEQWQAALAPLEEILQRAKPASCNDAPAELELTPTGKARRIRCQVYSLDDEGTAGTLIQLRDRDVLQAIETDLRMAAQLRALTRVYRGVAHDLRAPLNAMVLNLELLRRSLDPQAPPRADLPERQQHWLTVIEQEMQRLRRALDVLLAQTAPPSEKTERFDLRGVVEEIASLLLPQARHQQVELITTLPDEYLPVTAFRDQIKQAALNVAINALEVMPDGGKLTLAVEHDTTHVRLRVSDTGPGIPAEQRDRIFEMHFTTKQSGTGIGLYVARSIFEAQGGSVHTASSGAEGTTFELTLPMRAEGST